jgi:predicted enzyme related to lactoylglutathione lyase
MDVKVKSFVTIRMSVENVARSRDWYSAFFGCAPIDDLEQFVSFRIQQTNLDITLADDKSPFSPGGSVGYWLVAGLDEAINHAVRLGGRIYRGPLRVEEVQRTIVQIQDPFGNVFGLEANFAPSSD